MFEAAELERQLSVLIERHGIPGAQLAVLDGDRITEVAAGVLHLGTGSPTTPDALFLPGSIGKLYTATLVLMLVDAGKLDLDTPIRHYLPDFEVADPDARDRVTARHLLSHTSGFDGDVFIDTGRGEDALARYLKEIVELPQICDPGAIWSYSNSGYAILGRLVEVLTGQTFETVLAERLFAPLGLQHTVAFAEEALLHPVAVGHLPDPENPNELMVTPSWGLFRSCGPMGASLVASAGDVLRFARLHLDGGRGPDGGALLAGETVTAMQQPQVGLVDDSVLGDSWGLGWLLDHWGPITVIGHDGNSIGQNAFMRLAPEHRFGFCLQTNVESALLLYRELADWLFGARLGVRPRPDPERTDSPVVTDPGRYVGRYQRSGLDFAVTSTDQGRLQVTVTASHAAAETQQLPPMIDLPLQPVTRRDAFLLKLPIADTELLAVFFNPQEPAGAPTYLHFGARVHRRLA